MKHRASLHIEFDLIMNELAQYFDEISFWSSLVHWFWLKNAFITLALD